MKEFKQYLEEGGILLGKTVNMGDRRGRIIQTVKSGPTSRYDDTYLVKFQDGTKIEMHDVQIRPFLESVELDEYRRKDVYAIVDKKGKVVAANLTKQNAHKEISRHRDGTIVLDPDAKVGDTLKFFAKENAPVNSMGMGGSSHFNQDGNVQGIDPLLRGATGATAGVSEQFAGVEVFDLSPEEYQNCVNGRNKYERWSRKLNMEDGTNQSIRRYSHRNPGKDIIVRDSRTGMMAYLKRK